MNVLRIINEPNAAAIAYDLNKSQVSLQIFVVILYRTNQPVKIVRSATAFWLRLEPVTIALSRMGGDLTTGGILYIAKLSLFPTVLPTRNSQSELKYGQRLRAAIGDAMVVCIRAPVR